MPGEHQNVAEHRDHAGREQLIERIDVGRHARHQPADRMPVVVPEFQLLQVLVHLRPKPVHDALAGGLQDECLAVFGKEPKQQQPQVGQHHPAQARQITLRDVAIDGLLGDPRLRQLDERRQQNGAGRQRHRAQCGRR